MGPVSFAVAGPSVLNSLATLLSLTFVSIIPSSAEEPIFLYLYLPINMVVQRYKKTQMKKLN